MLYVYGCKDIMFLDMMQYLKIRVFYKYLLIVKSFCRTGVGPCPKIAPHRQPVPAVWRVGRTP